MSKPLSLHRLLQAATANPCMIEGVFYSSIRVAAQHLQITKDRVRARLKSNSPTWSRWIPSNLPVIRYVYNHRVYNTVAELLRKEKIGFVKYERHRKQHPYHTYYLTFNNIPLRTEQELRQYLENDIRYPTQIVRVTPSKPRLASTPCVIKGKTYSSVREASRAIGISYYTLLYRIKKQTPGYAIIKQRNSHLLSPRVQFVVQGKVYDVLTQVAKDLNLSRTAVRSRLYSRTYPDHYFLVDKVYQTKSAEEIHALLETPVTQSPE